MKIIKKYFIAAACVLFLGAGGYYAYVVLTGNFHAVTPGEAYRSAQLGPGRLEKIIVKHKIKSVLNLRGEKPGERWFEDEKQVCGRNQVQHFNVKLSAVSKPSEENIKELVRIFHSARRPVLIHCHGGADRSGLVSAMWKAAVDNESKAEAKKQLTFLYGHKPWGKERLMDEFFAEWKARKNEGSITRKEYNSVLSAPFSRGKK